MPLKFITGSQEKVKEVQKLLPGVEQEAIDLLEIQSLDAQEIMRHKMEQARTHVTEPFIIEDTALYIEDLNGFPGPLIKWFNDQVTPKRIGELFAESKAYAETMVGYWDGENEHYFTGRLDGRIIEHRTLNGYGFDIIFLPDGHDGTLAEMSVEEKNKISHRGKAMKKLKNHLEDD